MTTRAMTPHCAKRSVQRLLAPTALVLAGACIQPAPYHPPSVSISAAHVVEVGEALPLAVATHNGTDNRYRFISSRPAIASVDADGVITGVTPGETTIVVNGLDTGAVGSHFIVVVAAASPPGPEGPAVPHYDEWQSSPHADDTAEAFRHWDEEGEVEASCARCHSRDGYRDYLGDDGTAPGSVESPAAVGSVVDCNTCHNNAADALDHVTFPSGTTVEHLGPEARCMVCHQGRASSDTVDDALAASAAGPDEVDLELGFINVHYFPAAATLYAGRARGGYQYEGRVYDTRFRHAPGFESCVGCHNPHSTQVRYESCGACHSDVNDAVSARTIRMIASRNQDYDGDGDTDEGIYEEVEGLRTQLLEAIMRYGAEDNLWVCYDLHTYPYFFTDTDKNGACDEAEAVFPNRYQAFTPRLVKAAYNFQMATKDPGAFAHNGKYIIELLHDALQDLNQGLTVPFDLTDLVRTDVGHFDGASEAARHWDADEAVSASCSRCHSGSAGFRFYVEYGGALEVEEPANGLDCATCHTTFGDAFALVEVGATTFPGGRTLPLEGEDNLCSTCHSGRASKATIDAAIAANAQSGAPLNFQNVHYLAAAGTLLGSLAQVGYEFDDRVYSRRLVHDSGSQCTTCHDASESNHTFAIADVWSVRCDLCHGDADGPEGVRVVHLADYDGDGDTGTSLATELSGLTGAALQAMNDAGGVCYRAGSYPYFFKDSDGSGPACDEGEANFGNRFTAWTPPLLRVAHNVQLSLTEPGAYAHNFSYMGQLLYDSVEHLDGAPPANLVRPEVTP